MKYVDTVPRHKFVTVYRHVYIQDRGVLLSYIIVLNISVYPKMWKANTLYHKCNELLLQLLLHIQCMMVIMIIIMQFY